MRANLLTLALLMSGCASVPPATVKPTPPIVRCDKPAASLLAAPPRASEWVTCAPVAGGGCAAVLSAAGAEWVVLVLAWARTEQSRRVEEHACTDELAKKGVIQK